MRSNLRCTHTRAVPIRDVDSDIDHRLIRVPKSVVAVKRKPRFGPLVRGRPRRWPPLKRLSKIDVSTPCTATSSGVLATAPVVILARRATASRRHIAGNGRRRLTCFANPPVRSLRFPRAVGERQRSGGWPPASRPVAASALARARCCSCATVQQLVTFRTPEVEYLSRSPRVTC